MAWHKGSFAPRCRPLLVRVVSGRDDGYVAKHEESDQRRFLHPHQSRRGPRPGAGYENPGQLLQQGSRGLSGLQSNLDRRDTGSSSSPDRDFARLLWTNPLPDRSCWELPERVRATAPDVYSHHMAELPDPELMRKITEDPYFQSQIERQVRTRVNEQLDQTKKVVGPALLILLAAGGFYSFTSIKDLNAKKKELETKVEEKIKELNTRIEVVVKEAAELDKVTQALNLKSQAAKTEFELYDRTASSMLRTFGDDTARSIQSIQRTHDELTGEIDKFDLSQNKARTEATNLLDRLKTETAAIETTKKELSAVAEKAAGEVSEAGKIRSQLILEQQRFRQANSDLLKATQVQYLLLHSDGERFVTMYAPRAAGAPGAESAALLTPYQLKIQTEKVRPGSKVKISVIAGAAGTAGSSREYPLAEGVRAQIDDVPFDYEVQFIYHASILTHHFTVIRLSPHDTPALQ